MGLLEGLGHALRGLWKVLKAAWNLCKTFWGVWMAQKGIFWRFGSPLRRILEPFGASRSALGASWTRLGVLLARSWEHLRGFWKVFGCHFRAWNASLKRFAELLKNHQKHCKVLQKSGFGESKNCENHAWGLQVGPSDWLWTAKLTPGDALGLQVELPKALEAAQGATLELRKLWESPEITQSPRSSEVFPYLSGSPYD